jgi:hypothetical protein
MIASSRGVRVGSHGAREQVAVDQLLMPKDLRVDPKFAAIA